MKRFLRLSLLFLSFAILLAACGSSTTSSTSSTSTTTPAPVTVNVFAAASLTESFTEIGRANQQQHSNVTVKFYFIG